MEENKNFNETSKKRKNSVELTPPNLQKAKVLNSSKILFQESNKSDSDNSNNNE